ncbi:flavin reductase [Methylovirgula ligni]|uniref:Flavin reductase (DIM6/NTAB) family NADH-FMN oxidoreductase RutF n=1 Tax=Methylovirgula ligni TaxID=569860 RepID=A0A3D9YZ95_9HYPH|nr:flavin reductase family protein [Methylovirgula ligni]QAY96962.1 flavin reductase [Methylovirgula ligni]REF87977.1 flavin reductase (DIM6/NTAB) family NADH-FMN oxidoreductase RutF [Methylovirgula ligni]
MFYAPEHRDKSLLPHDPFKALIAPRPIGWVSTKSKSGAINLAPYSFFNAVAEKPPILMLSSSGWKDSATFASETREFVWNMATYDLHEKMNLTAANLPRGESEFAFAGLEPAPSRFVAPPRVALSPAALECKVVNILSLQDMDGGLTGNILIFGQVVGVYIDDAFIRDGRVDAAAMRPLARCGYMDYAVADHLFEMLRPPRI